MTDVTGPVAVVVSDDPALMASLPFHCALELDFDVANVATADAVLIDLGDPEAAEQVLARVADVDGSRLVALANRPPDRPVAHVLLRPVSVSAIGMVLEQVAASSTTATADEDDRSPEPHAAAAPRDDRSFWVAARAGPPVAAPTDVEHTTEEEHARPAGRSDDAEGVPPEEPEIHPAAVETEGAPDDVHEDVRTATQESTPLFDAVRDVSRSEGPAAPATRTPPVDRRAIPDADTTLVATGSVSVWVEGPASPVTAADTTPWALDDSFTSDVLDATVAVERITDVLRRYPALSWPVAVLGEVALDVVEAAGLEMLGLWHRQDGQHRYVGGHALRPSDERRQIPDDHPLLRRARSDGGLVVDRVADDPAAVAGLPGVYQDSIVLLPVVTERGNELLVVGAGHDLDGRSLDRVEEALRASATVIDLGIALEQLLAVLED